MIYIETHVRNENGKRIKEEFATSSSRPAKLIDEQRYDALAQAYEEVTESYDPEARTNDFAVITDPKTNERRLINGERITFHFNIDPDTNERFVTDVGRKREVKIIFWIIKFFEIFPKAIDFLAAAKNKFDCYILTETSKPRWFSECSGKKTKGDDHYLKVEMYSPSSFYHYADEPEIFIHEFVHALFCHEFILLKLDGRYLDMEEGLADFFALSVAEKIKIDKNFPEFVEMLGPLDGYHSYLDGRYLERNDTQKRYCTRDYCFAKLGKGIFSDKKKGPKHDVGKQLLFCFRELRSLWGDKKDEFDEMMFDFFLEANKALKKTIKPKNRNNAGLAFYFLDFLKDARHKGTYDLLNSKSNRTIHWNILNSFLDFADVASPVIWALNAEQFKETVETYFPEKS